VRRPVDVRAVVLFISGPGRTDELLDSIDSVLASEGEDVQIIVVDDCSIDTRESVVRARYPQVDVLRSGIPVLGPPNITPLTLLGIRHALARYRFDHCIKMDSDALVTGPRLTDAIESRVGVVPDAGLAGAHMVRCDGAPYDNVWFHAETLAYEMRRDRTLRAAAERAVARGWTPGEIVEGGVCALTREACEALASNGWLDWRPPRSSIVSEDLVLSTFVRAAGLRLVQLGGPEGIFAVDTKLLPLPKDEVAAGPWVAAHSVKRGIGGEPEDVLRSFFRAARSRWQAEPTYAV
jgi:glycosyltransferase involved in cell wall biosynthesis